MFKIDFKFDEKAFERNAQQQARKAVEDKVSRVRCPDHGQTARVEFTGDGWDMNWEVKGCCQRLAEEVKKALKD